MPEQETRLTRRAFVVGGVATAAAVGVAGWFGRGGQAAEAARKNLADFLHVSRLVTGVDDLPEPLAPTYLAKLEAADLPMSPSTLGRLGRNAETLDELERTVLREPGGKECAEQIAGAWWSGTVPEGDGREVVTYLDALVFRGAPFMRPQTECLGEIGAWARPGKLAA